MRTAIIISSLAISLTGIAVAQNPVNHSFAGNPVKSLVYQITNRVYHRISSLVNLGQDEQLTSNTLVNSEIARPVLASYTETAVSHVNENASLEAYLTKAAGLTCRVNETEEISEAMDADNTLEAFLVQASGLKKTVEVTEESNTDENAATDNSLEEFLSLASGLKNNVKVSESESFSTVENEMTGNSLEEFLIQASGLKNPVEISNEDAGVNGNSADISLEEFLVRASGLKDQRVESNN